MGSVVVIFQEKMYFNNKYMMLIVGVKAKLRVIYTS